MKKIVTTLLFLAVLAVNISSVQGQERAKDKNLATWSLGIKGGIDYFRVEPYATATTDWWWKGSWRSYALQASWSAPFVFVEYTANHWFGVGLELAWLHYNRGLKESSYVPGTLNTFAPKGVYYGHTADAVLYGSVNLTNLVAPYRRGGWRVLSVYINGGFGGGWYHYRTPDDKSDKGGNNFVCNGGGNALTFLGMASITTAFNVSKVWELFMEGQYRSYTKENMGGFTAPGHSVDAITFLLGIRWKLGNPKASDKQHTRNELAQDNGAELLAEAIAAKKTAEDGVAAANQRVDDLEGRVKNLENAPKATRDDLDGAAKNLPVVDDSAPKATKDELEDAIKNLQRQINDLRNNQATSGTTSFRDIRFNTDSHELTAESMAILDQVFNVLNNDAWTMLEVFGYTDNVASSTYNQKLSERRANEVKAYLVKKGLDASKIKTIGRGIRGSENSVYGRAENRRVDFRVSK